MTREDVTQAVLNYKRNHSQFAVRKMLERVAGVTAISEIPESKFGAILDACGKEPPPGDDVPNERAAADLDPDRIFAKWNSAGKRS